MRGFVTKIHPDEVDPHARHSDAKTSRHATTAQIHCLAKLLGFLHGRRSVDARMEFNNKHLDSRSQSVHLGANEVDLCSLDIADQRAASEAPGLGGLPSVIVGTSTELSATAIELAVSAPLPK